MGIDSSITDFLLDFAQVAPVVLFLALVVYRQYCDLKEIRNQTREQDRENLDTLKDLKVLLDGFFSKSDKDTLDILNKMEYTGKEIKDHIDGRIDVIKERLKND